MKNLLFSILILSFPSPAGAVLYSDLHNESSGESRAPALGTGVSQPGTGNTLDQTQEVPSNANSVFNSDDSALYDSVGWEADGMTVADRNLTRDIHQNLISRGEFKDSLEAVRIIVHNGRVTLQGTVRSQVESHNLVAAIEKLIGVTSVENQLRIKL